MKTRTISLAAAVFAASVLCVVAACTSTGHLMPKAWWVSYGGSSYCVENGKVKVTVAGESRVELAFKNAEGETIGEPTHIDGGTTVEIEIPEGAVAYDVSSGGNSSTSYDS